MLSTVDALPEVGPGVHQRCKKLGSGLLHVGHIAEGQLVRVVVKDTKVPLTRAFLVPRIAQYYCVLPHAHQTIRCCVVERQQIVQAATRVERAFVDLALVAVRHCQFLAADSCDGC